MDSGKREKEGEGWVTEIDVYWLDDVEKGRARGEREREGGREKKREQSWRVTRRLSPFLWRREEEGGGGRI